MKKIISASTFSLVLILSVLFMQCKETPVQSMSETNSDSEFLKGGKGKGGNPGDTGMGGKPGDTDKKRGGDFGDLFILWRNADGAPIYIAVESEEHGTSLKVQPIAFNGSWTVVDGKWSGVPAIDGGFPGEYFYDEAFAYDYWSGFYDIGSFELDGTWNAHIGLTTVDYTVVPYNAEGDLDYTSDYVPAGVEIGRKNLSRAPQNVLNRALDEALKTLTLDESPLTIDYCGRLVGKTVNDEGQIVNKTIDSPRENMALYQYIMQHNGTFEGLGAATDKLNALIGTRGINNPLDVAAGCFAAAADKSDNLCVDEIVYCNTFLGINGPAEERHYNHYTNYTYNLDRERFKTRWIKIVTLNSDGTYTEERLSLWQAIQMEKFKLTQKYNGEYNLAAFRTAADDAIQILDYIHGDSNMEWLGHGSSWETAKP